MRILWYNWRDIKNPEAGGAEVFTHEVCKRIVKQDGVDSVTLFSASFPGGFAEEKIDGVKIVRRGNKYSVYSEAKKFYNQNKDYFDIIVDEINTKPFHTPSFVHDKPVVALIHQLAREFWFYETRFPINIIGYLFLEKYWLKKYRNVPTITVSKSTAEDLTRLGFEHVTIVPEGLGFELLEGLPEKEAKPTILFVGRLKKAKKPDDVLRAFKIIKDEIPEAKLWIVGDGYMMKTLKKMAQRMFPEASDSITLFGMQYDKRKLELMSKAHVLLVPGVREGWGLVVTEANAMGTPAVAYDVPGLRDSVIDGVTGTLVTRGDYVGMAIEAVEILKDHIKRKSLSDNALQNAKHFDWDKTSARVMDILTESLFKHSKSAGEPRISELS